MKRFFYLNSITKKEDGATIVLVAILLVVFLGITALAIDVFHLYVVKNELQNAADAGALAGVILLTDETDPTKISTEANRVGKEAAENNFSEKVKVEVEWSTGNGPDVVRGHYNPNTKDFIANSNTTQAPIIDTNGVFIPKDELHETVGYINALKVVAWRGQRKSLGEDHYKRVVSFFAGIFGFKDFGMKAEAVAFIDFAGSIAVGEIDMPLAICEDSILKDPSDPNSGYTCGQARLINSAAKPNSDTGFWTNYSINCVNSFSTSDFNSEEYSRYDCQLSNSETIPLGSGISTTQGESNILEAVGCCGEFNGYDAKYCKKYNDISPESRQEPWKVTLPVVDCSSATPTCNPLVGAVTLEIIHITNTPTSPENLPDQMGAWEKDSELSDLDNWKAFVNAFDLKIRYEEENYVAYEVPDQSGEIDKDSGLWNKTIYALPSCEKVEIKSGPGGPNIGIESTSPVLVPFTEILAEE